MSLYARDASPKTAQATNPAPNSTAGSTASSTANATPPARTAPHKAAVSAQGASSDGAWTVTQLTLTMKGKLEEMGDVVVCGEISGLKVAAQGHWYFDLKDKNAKIAVVVFFKDTRRSPAIPREGESVVVTGTASYHLGFGKAQLLGRLVLPVGEGVLARKLEELKNKLAADGLFDVARKRPLPPLPTTIGVVTSLNGAAIRDVLTVIETRSPSTSIIVAPTKVQGDGAAADVADAIRRLDALGRCAVILVVRGGGAREDLHAFNTEPVVRAIAGCKVPVVAGVGHEVDVTLADLAADVRAATPSQAAELAVPRHDELSARVRGFERRLQSLARGVVDRERRRLHDLEKRLPSPATLVQQKRRRVQMLDERLSLASPQQQLSKRAKRLDELRRQLERQDPRGDVVSAVHAVDGLDRRLREALQGRFDDAGFRLQRGLEQLDALSPTAVLRRGWALVTVGDDPTRIARPADLVPGNRLRVRIDGGDANVIVDDVTGTRGKS